MAARPMPGSPNSPAPANSSWRGASGAPAPGSSGSIATVAINSTGRVFVADRSNNRIEIFSPDGAFLQEWKQFGRPSGLFIDKNDILYATNSESNTAQNPGFKRGVREFGSVKDGKVIAFIPDPVPAKEELGAAGSS